MHKKMVNSVEMHKGHFQNKQLPIGHMLKFNKICVGKFPLEVHQAK